MWVTLRKIEVVGERAMVDLFRMMESLEVLRPW